MRKIVKHTCCEQPQMAMVPLPPPYIPPAPPVSGGGGVPVVIGGGPIGGFGGGFFGGFFGGGGRSEEHTSELQSLMRISYAVFCLKKKKMTNTNIIITH